MRATIAVVVVSLSTTIPVAAQPVPRPFREAFVVETDATAEKKLAAVVDYVSQQRWEAAIALLREVVAAKPEALIRVSPTRSISIARYGDVLLTQLPPEGLAVYRRGVDPQAAAWLAEAEATGDERSLHAIINRAFASSAGAEAALQLAERAWERGDFEQARRYAMLRIPLARPEGSPPAAILRTPAATSPDVDAADLARVRSRLILCSIALGEHTRAKQEIAAFRHAHPGTVGRIAGVEGPVADRLTAVLNAAVGGASSQDRSGWDVLPPLTASETFGAAPNRSGFLTHAPATTSPCWYRPLPRARPDPLLAPADAGVLSRYPVVWNGRVFVADADRVYGFDLDTGRAAWAIDENDPGVLYPPVVAEEPVPGNDDSSPVGRRRASATPAVVGAPRHTLTVHGDRLFARLGSPMTGWPARELRPSVSTIVCLDLAREGLLTWSFSSTALGSDDESWAFEGPPVAVGDRLYLLACRGRPQAQLNALCLNATTGAVLWNRRIGAPIAWPPEGAYVMSHRLATVAAGLLYVQTNQGAVVCLHADDGRPAWVGWYESRLRNDGANAASPERHIPSACLVAGGVVVTSPTDSDRLFAFDAATGVALWSRTIRGEARALVGAHDGRLVVSGERLSCLDLWTGRELWSAGFEDPPGAGSGRGLLARDRVYWPTREDLLVLALDNGAPVQRLPLKRLYGFAGGGNLAAGDDVLILARPDGLLTFGKP